MKLTSSLAPLFGCGNTSLVAPFPEASPEPAVSSAAAGGGGLLAVARQCGRTGGALIGGLAGGGKTGPISAFPGQVAAIAAGVAQPSFPSTEIPSFARACLPGAIVRARAFLRPIEPRSES